MDNQTTTNEEESDFNLPESNLPNLLKEEVNLEDFDISNDNESIRSINFLSSAFSPNITLSLLSITFVFERNGIVPTSLIFLYGVLTHLVFSNMTSKLLHSQQKKNISELIKGKFLFPFEKYYKTFCIIYYICILIFIVLIFKDIISPPLNYIAEHFHLLFLENYRSVISIFLFLIFNFIISIFSKQTQISILTISTFLSCISICFIAAKCFYLNYKNKYGSNRSLQIDNFNVNLLTSFCFFQFALNYPPLLFNTKYSDSSKCSVNGSLATFLKVLFLMICGYSMYVTYGRYINSTQLFSFHENDISANFCRMSYMISTMSMNVLFVDKLKSFVCELFENNLVDSLSQNHKIVTFLLFLMMPILFSLFSKASLPFIVICGAISFWIFEVTFTMLFSLFLKENGWMNFQSIFQLFLVAFAILTFVTTVFYAIRDVVAYYVY